MTQKLSKILVVIIFFAIVGCGSENGSPSGIINFREKKIQLNSTYKYSHINIYWEDNNRNKEDKRISINSNEILFSNLLINDTTDFNSILKVARLIQVDVATKDLGTILGVHFLLDTLKSDKVDFKYIVE